MMPEKAVLVMGIMYSDDNVKEKTVNLLVNKFGEIELEGKSFVFDFTDYYEEEFGKTKKFFISFKEKIDIGDLVEIKLLTNKLEKELSKEGKRRVNLDPGYVTKEKSVVASCKSRPHRIYLDKGVYAHLMFIFKKNDVISFKWTFEDYLQEKEFFVTVRERLFLSSK